MSNLLNGVIKEYPDFYTLESLPEVIFEHDYDIIFLNGKNIRWIDLLDLSIDRLLYQTGEKNLIKDKPFIIEHFYNFKFDPKSVREIFKTFPGSIEEWSDIQISKKVMNFDFISMRV
jgi:hypothetical protein